MRHHYRIVVDRSTVRPNPTYGHTTTFVAGQRSVELRISGATDPCVVCPELFVCEQETTSAGTYGRYRLHAIADLQAHLRRLKAAGFNVEECRVKTPFNPIAIGPQPRFVFAYADQQVVCRCQAGVSWRDLEIPDWAEWPESGRVCPICQEIFFLSFEDLTDNQLAELSAQNLNGKS